MSVEERLKQLNIVLPEVPQKAGMFENCKEFGNHFVYVSGCGPDVNGELYKKGKLGKEISVEEGQEAAGNCVLNALTILNKKLGSLDRIKSVVKVLAFVSSDPDFYSQPQAANGASQMLMDILGTEVGCPSRSAIGVSVLPGNIPIEVEMLVEIVNE